MSIEISNNYIIIAKILYILDILTEVFSYTREPLNIPHIQATPSTNDALDLL